MQNVEDYRTNNLVPIKKLQRNNKQKGRVRKRFYQMYQPIVLDGPYLGPDKNKVKIEQKIRDFGISFFFPVIMS